MFLIPLPWTVVLFLIRVGHTALSVLPPLLELAGVHFSIMPDFSAIPLHVGIFELASVGFLQVCKEVDAMAIEHSIREVALIVAAISPCVKAFSVLFALLEHACVLRII